MPPSTHKEIRLRSRGNVSRRGTVEIPRGNVSLVDNLRAQGYSYPLSNQLVNLISFAVAQPERYMNLLFQVFSDLVSGISRSEISRKIRWFYGDDERLMTAVRRFLVHWLTSPMVFRNSSHEARVERPEQRFTWEFVHNFYARYAERFGIVLPPQYLGRLTWDSVHNFYRRLGLGGGLILPTRGSLDRSLLD